MDKEKTLGQTEEKVLVEFIRPWGHPTRYQICGPGERYLVSRWAADNVIRGGYAVEVPRKKQGEV